MLIPYLPPDIAIKKQPDLDGLKAGTQDPFPEHRRSQE